MQELLTRAFGPRVSDTRSTYIAFLLWMPFAIKSSACDLFIFLYSAIPTGALPMRGHGGWGGARVGAGGLEGDVGRSDLCSGGGGWSELSSGAAVGLGLGRVVVCSHSPLDRHCLARCACAAALILRAEATVHEALVCSLCRNPRRRLRNKQPPLPGLNSRTPPNEAANNPCTESKQKLVCPGASLRQPCNVQFGRYVVLKGASPSRVEEQKVKNVTLRLI